MKQLLTRYALTAVLLVTLLPAALWSKDIPTIRVAAFNYYPAIFLDTDNQVRGFYVDMLDEIATREQLRFEYVFGSWSEGLERLRAGEVDLVTSAAYTEERATFMDFGEQVLLTVWGELYIPQDAQTASITGFQDQPIAVMRGDHNARSFKEHLGKFGISSRFIEYADFDEVFAAVKAKQVNGGVVNSVFGDAAAKKYEVQSSGIAFNPFDIYFATAKGQNAEMLRLLDDYLLHWRNDSASVYYHARLKWGAGQEPEEVIPVWVLKLAAVAALVIFSGLVFIMLLRHRVNKATRELQKSNNMNRLLLDSTAEGIYGLDIQGICTFCNAACVQILGYDNADQLVGRNMHDLIHHSHADGTAMPAEECDLLKGLNRKVHCDSEMFWRADGSSFPVEYWSYPIRQDDNVIGLVVSFVDITERKKTEKALVEMKELRDQAEAIAHVGSWSLDLSRKQLTWSDEVYRIFGCEPQSFAANYEIFCGFVHPADRDTVETAYTDSMRKGNDFYAIEHRIIRKDTMEVRYVYEQGIHKRDAEGEVIRSLGMVQDITERKRIEQDLIEQKNAYQSILSASHDGFLALDTQGHILDVNPAYLTFSGYDRDELLNLHISEIDADENAEDAALHINKVMTQGSDLFESGHRRRDGSVWSAEVSTTYSPLNGGRFFTFLRDITERKQAQWALEQKNQELEQFVYSVSHDLKSPLITVRAYAGMLRQDLLSIDQHQTNEDLNYIDKAAEKMQQLLDALLQYSRIGRINSSAQTLSAGQSVEDCLTALAGILQQQEIHVSTGELTQQLHGDPLHFGQIWQNLIENAVKYRGNQPQPHIEIGATQQEHEVVFYVRDNGMGIVPEHSERIFNLFSQLNPGSDGSGLGLALVKKIVSIYQGRIWVESAGEGKGSCFMFTLPGALIKDGTHDNQEEQGHSAYWG